MSEPYRGVGFSQAQSLTGKRYQARWDSRTIGWYHTGEQAAVAFNLFHRYLDPEGLQLHPEGSKPTFEEAKRRAAAHWLRFYGLEENLQLSEAAVEETGAATPAPPVPLQRAPEGAKRVVRPAEAHTPTDKQEHFSSVSITLAGAGRQKFASTMSAEKAKPRPLVYSSVKLTLRGADFVEPSDLAA